MINIKGKKNLPVHEYVEALYQGTEKAADFSEKVIQPQLGSLLKISPREEAIVGTYYRMCGWIYTMVKMNHKACFQAASAAARSLYELLIDIKLLAVDESGRLVQQFIFFPNVEKYRVAKKRVSFCEQYGKDTKLTDTNYQGFIQKMEKEDFLNKKIVELWGLNKKGEPKNVEHWSGINDVRSRANRLGLRYEEMYVESYPVLSWHIHSGSTGYAGLSEDTIEVMMGMAHLLALDVFLEATKVCSDEMKISKAIEWVPKTIDELKLTAGWILFGDEAKRLFEQGKL
ncbi:MAG: DUF5677 domain-containing protein [bacterium]